MSNLYEILDKAQIATSLGKYQLAIKLSQDVLSIAPNNAFAYYELAMAYLYLKNYDKAEEFIKLTLSFEPNLENSLVLYCVILFKKEQYQAALEKADEALKFNPHNETAIYFKACIFYNLRKYEEAEWYIKKALELSPNSNSYHSKLAEIYSDTNQKNLAEQEYLEALKQEPNDSISLNNYGLHILAQNWRNRKGLELLRASLRSNPDDRTVIKNYETYQTYQHIYRNLFYNCMKAYKEICEILLPKKDVFPVIIASLCLYFLNAPVCIRIYTVILPFLVLYIIAFIYTKKHLNQSPE